MIPSAFVFFCASVFAAAAPATAPVAAKDAPNVKGAAAAAMHAAAIPTPAPAAMDLPVEAYAAEWLVAKESNFCNSGDLWEMEFSRDAADSKTLSASCDVLFGKDF